MNSLFLLLCAALSSCLILICSAEYRLTIAHTNDVHSHIAPFTDIGATCLSSNGSILDTLHNASCFGGSSRRKTALDALRSQHSASDDLLVLDGGDEFQGTLFFSKYQGNASAYFMNELGYDLGTFGNHEFDEGPSVLASFVRQLNTTRIISSNIDWTYEPAFNGLEHSGNLVRSAILHRNGQDIGFVGYIIPSVPNLSSPGRRLRFLPIESSIQPIIDNFYANNITKVIAISHAGYDLDQLVASKVRGLDIIVGGHSHTYLGGQEPSSAGPYPTIATDLDGKKTCIVQDGQWGKYLGRFEAVFNDNGDIISCNGSPILMDHSIAHDPVVQRHVEAFAAPLASYMFQTAGISQTELVEATCRSAECTFGCFLADALLWQVQSSGAHAAIVNGGNIRSGIAAGSVSIGQLMESLPFSNFVQTAVMTGQALVHALEHSVASFDSSNHGSSGGFLQIAGLRFTYDPTKRAGARVVRAQIRNGTQYEDVQLQQHYKVASNSFVFSGGDGFVWPLAMRSSIDEFGFTIAEVAINYLKAFSPIHPILEGRIAVTGLPVPETPDVPIPWYSSRLFFWIMIGIVCTVGVIGAVVGSKLAFGERQRRIRAYRQLISEVTLEAGPSNSEKLQSESLTAENAVSRGVAPDAPPCPAQEIEMDQLSSFNGDGMNRALENNPVVVAEPEIAEDIGSN